MRKPISSTRHAKLNIKKQALFLSIFAKLLNNGFAIETALESMRLILPAHNQLLVQLIKRLNYGSGLAESLKITGLSKTILSQIAIADIHGNLIKCLQENASTLTLRQKNFQKILNLLAYPCFLLISLLSLVIFLKVEMSQQLPHLTLPPIYWLIIKIIILIICLVFATECL
ncbi:hypothetical protein EQ500_12000, partial [Lactobacillus sp. XV13L]|nr:hypothetical protein [Lactobacillus sp. XV13L]